MLGLEGALNPMAGVLIRERQGGMTGGRKKPREDRDWSDSATNHGIPGPLKALRSREGSFPTDREETWPCQHLQRFWTLKLQENKCVVSRHQASGRLSRQPRDPGTLACPPAARWLWEAPGAQGDHVQLNLQSAFL